MPTIEELNRSWEATLTEFNARTWARMKAVGATAAWEKAGEGQTGAHSSGITTGTGGDTAANDYVEFVVQFRGNDLVREARTGEPEEALVAGTLFRAARMLESLGVQVIPRDH